MKNSSTARCRTPHRLARAERRDGRSEDFLWDGLALVKRGDMRLVNEPHAGGGSPVLSSSGTAYFSDILGTTLGARERGRRYAAASQTAFGEGDAAFFTGKPQIPGIGRAFLFWNYRPDLGKWQTADPLGYPDGWNSLAYCGNEVTDYVDLYGAYARCVFKISDAVFAMGDDKTGKMLGVSAYSGDMNLAHQWIASGVLPLGLWYIIAYPGAERFQLWYAGDSKLDDIAEGPNGAVRTNIRLVIAPAFASHGCICLDDEDSDSSEIMRTLKDTSYEWKRMDGLAYRCYGTVTVIE